MACTSISRKIKYSAAWKKGLAEWGVGDDYTVTGVEPGLVTSGFLNEGFRSVVRNDAERKEAKLKTFGLNIDYQMGDNWNMAFDGAHSKVDKTITNVESYSGVGRNGLASQGPASARSWVMTPEGACTALIQRFPRS